MTPRVVMAGLSAAILLWPAAASSQSARPPDLDCSLGFDGLRSAASALPGATAGRAGVTVASPEWRSEFAFSTPGQAAHPSVTLRTFLKQVTGVWTAQSKGCGFGGARQFAALMAEMRRQDSELTNASRAAVEKRKQDASPLGTP